MYSVAAYGTMAADGVRMDAYERAITRFVTPGSIVVDIGSGTGMFALLAARAGARRVHAVDINPAVWLIADLAASSGFGDRITVHHQSSLELTLPEPADVVVSDLRGSFPLFEEHLAILRDAKERLLAAGGTLLPMRDELMVAVVEAPDAWRDWERAWGPFERRGFDVAALRSCALNGIYTDSGRPLGGHQMLSEAKSWAEVHYGDPFPAVFEGAVDVPIVRGGTAHALAIWFRSTLAEGIAYEPAPGHQLVYSRLMLPLENMPRVEAGSNARLRIKAGATGDRWAWESEFRGAGDAPPVRSRQASFFGMPTSPHTLAREASTFAPERSARGERARRALQAMEGHASVEQIVSMIAESSPGVSAEQILIEVRSDVRHFSR